MSEFRRASRALADEIINIMAEIQPPMGVRQMFYQCVVRELVPNDRSGYRKVQRLLDLLRDSAEIDEYDIVDRSRPVLEAAMWNNAGELIAADAEQYRRNVWVTQPERVEVWLEKDALVGVVEEVTQEFGVVLVPARGFSSRTGIFQAAERINDSEKPTTIYYLGDHDPSGRDMDRDILNRLDTKFGAQPTLTRIAILQRDIARFRLPPQRVKTTDSRASKFLKRFGTRTVELDALPPDELRRRIREAIRSHIDDDAWQKTLLLEKRERESLAAYAKGWSLSS